MSAALKLQAAPAFEAPVKVPVPGQEKPTVVRFTFRHRTRKALAEWIAVKDRTDVEAILEMATGWELSDPFDADNVGELVENYHGAARAVFDTYVEQLAQVRLGN